MDNSKTEGRPPMQPDSPYEKLAAWLAGRTHVADGHLSGLNGDAPTFGDLRAIRDELTRLRATQAERSFGLTPFRQRLQHAADTANAPMRIRGARFPSWKLIWRDLRAWVAGGRNATR